MTIRRISRAMVFSLLGMWLTDSDVMQASVMQPVSIIFDTDIGTDVDDAGALAMLHVLTDRGEANILATISANQNRWAAPAIDVINTYYGRSHIPVGSSRTGPNDEYWYKDIVPKFPHNLADGADAPDAVALYRNILTAQPDHSVTIVVVGWLTNMANLLSTPPDDFSPLTGRQLISAKVKELVVMGGKWPNLPDEVDYNFHMDSAAAHKVISDWPGKIMFTGLGRDVLTGARLMTHRTNDQPIRAFYSKFFEANKVSARPSWDQIAVLYAVRGLHDYFTAVTEGQCVSQTDGSNEWGSGPTKNHGYLVYKMPQEKLAAVIEDLMLVPPAR